jgi:hypothetical protein
MEALCTALIACHPKPVILRTAFKSSSGQLLALASASPEASASLLGMEALLGTFVEAIDHSADRRLASSRLARERMFRPPLVRWRTARWHRGTPRGSPRPSGLYQRHRAVASNNGPAHRLYAADAAFCRFT